MEHKFNNFFTNFKSYNTFERCQFLILLISNLSKEELDCLKEWIQIYEKDFKLEDSKPEDSKPEDSKPEDSKSGDSKKTYSEASKTNPKGQNKQPKSKNQDYYQKPRCRKRNKQNNTTSTSTTSKDKKEIYAELNEKIRKSSESLPEGIHLEDGNPIWDLSILQNEDYYKSLSCDNYEEIFKDSTFSYVHNGVDFNIHILEEMIPKWYPVNMFGVSNNMLMLLNDNKVVNITIENCYYYTTSYNKLLKTQNVIFGYPKNEKNINFFKNYINFVNTFTKEKGYNLCSFYNKNFEIKGKTYYNEERIIDYYHGIDNNGLFVDYNYIPMVYSKLYNQVNYKPCKMNADSMEVNTLTISFSIALMFVQDTEKESLFYFVPTLIINEVLREEDNTIQIPIPKPKK